MPVNYQTSDTQIHSLLLLLKLLRNINAQLNTKANFHDMTLTFKDLKNGIQTYHLAMTVEALIPGLQYLNQTVTNYLFERRPDLLASRLYHYVYYPETNGYLPNDYFTQPDLKRLMHVIIKVVKYALKLGDN